MSAVRDRVGACGTRQSAKMASGRGGVGVSHAKQAEATVFEGNCKGFPAPTPLLSNAGLIGTNCLRACESESAPFGQGGDMLMGCYPAYLCTSKGFRLASSIGLVDIHVRGESPIG